MGANSEKTNFVAFLCLIIFGTTFGLPRLPVQMRRQVGFCSPVHLPILMEASTKSVIYEKAPDERRSPASITKIMTAILIFDAIEAGKFPLRMRL